MEELVGLIHCAQQFSDMQVIPYGISCGWTGKSSQGKWGRTGGCWGSWQKSRVALGKWEGWVREEGWMKAGKAGLEPCSGNQIPKVAWRGRLEEWIKCPVDACETGVRMTQLGWESCRPGWLAHYGTSSERGLRTKYSQPLCWKDGSGTAKPRLKTLLKRRRWPLRTKRSFLNTAKGWG